MIYQTQNIIKLSIEKKNHLVYPVQSQLEIGNFSWIVQADFD